MLQFVTSSEIGNQWINDLNARSAFWLFCLFVVAVFVLTVRL